METSRTSFKEWSVHEWGGAMWERLDEKYGTIRKQIDCIMSDFKSLPVCNDARSTLNMIFFLEHMK